MATNYMTVNEYEIDMLNARLWRLKQAIDNPVVSDTGAPVLDQRIMEYRYKVTKLLRDVLYMQNYVWECADDEEYERWKKECPDPEQLVKDFDLPVDIELAEGMYKDELDTCESFGPDRAFLDIYDPMNWWSDLSKGRKKEFNDEAKKCLENFRKSVKG